jgi:phosphonate transport system substrate-binding protein
MLSRICTACLTFMLAALVSPANAEQKTYSFGVLPQRSAVLTAQYWNPILEFVSHKAGITLELKITHTAPECNAAITQSAYDFVYANTIFHQSNVVANYQVILRPQAKGISGQIVTLEDSPIKTLAELEGKVVGFPSRTAFVGYFVPFDHLLRNSIKVVPEFGGNQEGIMGQLKTKRVIAAGVNSQVMKAFAARENVAYRVLWESEVFNEMPIAVHPRIEQRIRDAVQRAFEEMNTDPEGQKILETSASVIKKNPPYGFLSSTQGDYKNYIDFYKNTLVKETE